MKPFTSSVIDFKMGAFCLKDNTCLSLSQAGTRFVETDVRENRRGGPGQMILWG
jgi:hypothetical protein